MPAGETVELTCRLTLKSPGDYSAEMTVFVEDRALLHQVPLAIHGRATVSEEAANDNGKTRRR